MKKLLLLLLLLTTLPLPASEPTAHGVVLMYHRFGEERYPTTNIRLEQFKAQLDYLQREGFTIWPLRRMLDAIFNGGDIPDKTVSLTVDDAYLSVYTHAFPILRQRALPMTVFVSTDAVDEEGVGIMSWQQMREMQRHGIDFANHGAGHLHLAHRKEGESHRQWCKRIRRDLEQARNRLEQELGPQGRPLLAYPFGEYNTELAQLVGSMGYLALGQHSGAIGPNSDRLALPRFAMNEHYAHLDSFATKVASLPLPLAGQQPREPELSQENPPRLTLRLSREAPLSARQISCFLGDGSALEVLEKSERSLTVRSPHALPRGRSRYNCTAPAGDGRYYWFTQPWFNGADPADPAY